MAAVPNKFRRVAQSGLPGPAVCSLSRPSLTPPGLRAADVLPVTVVDTDLDLDPSAADGALALARVAGGGGGAGATAAVPVALREAGAASGIFTGELVLQCPLICTTVVCPPTRGSSGWSGECV